MITKISNIAYKFEKLLFDHPPTPNWLYDILYKPLEYACIPINVIIILFTAMVVIIGRKLEEFWDEVCDGFPIFTGVCGYIVIGLIIVVWKLL